MGKERSSVTFSVNPVVAVQMITITGDTHIEHGTGGQVNMSSGMPTLIPYAHWESCPSCHSRDLVLAKTPITDLLGYEKPIQYKVYCRNCNLMTDLYYSEQEAVSSWNEYAIQCKKENHELTDEEKVFANNPYLDPDWAKNLLCDDSVYRHLHLEILCDGFNRIVHQLIGLKQASGIISTSHQSDSPQDLDKYLRKAMDSLMQRAKNEESKKDAK